MISPTKRTYPSDMNFSALVPKNTATPTYFDKNAPKSPHFLTLRSLKIWKNQGGLN